MSDNPNHLCEPQISEEYEAWAHERIHESIAQNNIWVEKYKINDWPRWDYSLEHATLTFSEDGNLKVVCSIQAVGSAQEDSWEWSWGNANLPDACKTRMSEVKQFGEKKQWGRLASLFLKNEESLGWNSPQSQYIFFRESPSIAVQTAKPRLFHVSRHSLV